MKQVCHSSFGSIERQTSGRCYMGEFVLAATTIPSPCGQGALMGRVLLGLVSWCYIIRLVIGCKTE